MQLLYKQYKKKVLRCGFNVWSVEGSEWAINVHGVQSAKCAVCIVCSVLVRCG